ncbi:Zn2/Cys6 DNA-binding protein [Glarea lozoyensis ATCC 20868]|uniref:Zn2/Cys6 DNA-binding protein n=1 Tax=Glarea lozoyensis (strain ATCC 20868 / MF5171) TaxID=1116229 RepID=S3DYH4_GLAL2|nr:Zn2/Cys6 DNA-binding protein [Glarea lozoyensis ATCC 20868]EPE36991.1 Zn2/Cys6 DNA-binding protein [Glarea lozoyensis ATCC 20868]
MAEFAIKSTSQASRDKSIPRTLQRVASKDGSRSRSAHGCWTCRLRRKKCDEKGPECVTCTDRGLKCSGFGAIKPRWMDGGAQQDAVHREIKATVASVTRMKRMLKLVQAREKASPGRRSASIPVDAFDNASKSFYRNGSFSSGVLSRPASVGPGLPQSFSMPDPQVWGQEMPCDWNFGENFNMASFDGTDNFSSFAPEFYNSALEDDIGPHVPAMSNTNFFLPSQASEVGQFYQYTTPEPESYTTSTAAEENSSKYNMFSQLCTFPPSPALSITALDRPDIRTRQATPSRMQEVFTHEDQMVDESPSQQSNISKRTSVPSRQVQLSPVCENHTSQSSSVSKYPPLLPKAECPQPCNQVNIQSLEQSATQQAWMHPSVASVAETRAQSLRAASMELSILQNLLLQNVQQHLKQAVACVLKIRDDYLLECESLATRVLSEVELEVLGASIRFVLWTDITTRTFEGPEVESPFRGHISHLLEVNKSSQTPLLGLAGPVEDWIFTGIESVTRLAQMRSQLANEGLFDLREFQHHETSVLSNLEYRLNADDHSSHDKLPNTKTMLRRSIFLHAIMIYFYVVVQGPFSDAFDIRKNVDIVIRDLLALNDPHALMTEFTWPFLVAASMAGPEHHVALMGMFSSPLTNPTPRFTSVFQVVQECWLLRAQGAAASDWRSARLSLEQRGYFLDTACW